MDPLRSVSDRQDSIDAEFTAFFTSMYGPLLSFATAWGNSHHDADEAVGTVMADMYRRWPEIRHPVAYARRAVTWTILKIRRDRRDDRCLSAPGDRLPDAVADAPEFDRLEGEQWVDGLLAELSAMQYAVLSRFLAGLSMKEIAGELRRSESTIRQNFKLARDRLRPFVEEFDRGRSCSFGSPGEQRSPSAKQRTREGTR